jgi:hypothetical protein
MMFKLLISKLKTLIVTKSNQTSFVGHEFVDGAGQMTRGHQGHLTERSHQRLRS